MTNDTTTIEITTEQRDALVARKQHDREPYHEVVARLLDGSDGTPPADHIDIDELIDAIGAEVGGPTVDDSEIAREVARQIDYAQLGKKVADEVEARLP